jgi:hypothetical protein
MSELRTGSHLYPLVIDPDQVSQVVCHLNSYEGISKWHAIELRMYLVAEIGRHELGKCWMNQSLEQRVFNKEFRHNNHKDGVCVNGITWSENTVRKEANRGLIRRGITVIFLLAVYGCGGAEPPPSVSGLRGVVSLGKIDLSWTNPDNSDFTGVRICHSTSTHPDDPASCQPIYTGNASGFADTEVANGHSYYYAVWAYDAGGNYSTRTTLTSLPTPYPASTAPPPPPVNQPAFSQSGGAIIEAQRMFITDTGLFLVSDGKRRDVLRVNPTSFQIIEALHLDDKPLAVARLGDDIYVGKEEEGSIQIFSPKGAPKGYLVAPGNIGYPGSIDVDPAQGLVMVLDGKAQEVFIYNASSQALIWHFGSGELINPAGLAVDPSRQEILVSNIGDNVSNPFLSIFSYAGGSIGSLVATLTSSSCGSFGCASVGFSRPQGVAVYNDKIFLVDALRNQVLVYDRPTLTHLLTLGSADPLTRELRLPSDIEINAAGDVYVISRIENLIVKFAGGAL